jgi:hypothetical protein
MDRNGSNIRALEDEVKKAREAFNAARSDDTKEVLLENLNIAQKKLSQAMYPSSGLGAGSGAGLGAGLGAGSNQYQGPAGVSRHQGWTGNRISWGSVSVNSGPPPPNPRNPSGGKKHKSKQTRLRSKKYKGKRSKKTRRHRK